MATRTVRLDPDTERALQELKSATGLSVSGVLKRGILVFRQHTKDDRRPSAHAIYRTLDLGPGGYAIAPSTDTRRGVREALRRKLGR